MKKTAAFILAVICGVLAVCAVAVIVIVVKKKKK
jgi:hypothetical protein